MPEDYIKLDSFLKFMGLVGTGGEAKHLIQGGYVRVNGEVETRRGRKLRPDEVVKLGDREVIVKISKDESE